MDTVISIPVKQISTARKDLQIRDPNKSDYDDFEKLRDSMERHGLLEPIIVRLKGGSSYEVVVGNRRLQAAQELEWKTISSIVRTVDDVKLRRLAFVENVYREDIGDVERARAIASIYQDIGFPPEKAIQIVKHIHNKGKSLDDWKIKSLNTTTKGDLLSPTPSFLDACKDIGLSANLQYQLLQLIVQIEPEVLEEATRKGLTFGSKLGLTHPAIRKKSKKEQQEIIDDVKDYRGSKAKQRIRQHIEASKKGRASPQKVADKRTRDLLEVSMNITSAIDKLITTVTDRPLSRGEAFFTEKIIDSRQDQMFALLKAMGDTRQLDAFEEQIALLSHLVRRIEETIDKVRDINRKQREILKP